MKFIQSKKDKVPRRPFLDSNPLRDWIGILGCLFAAASAYQEISYNYFTFDGIVTTQFFMNNWDNFAETLIGASIDGMLRAGISFGLVVLILGGARRLISNQSQPLVISANKSKRKRVILLIFLAVIFGFFAAYGNASSKENENSNAKVNGMSESSKPIPLTCVPKDEDEVCISGFINNGTVMLNLRENLTEAVVDGTDEIKSTSFTLFFDCATKLTTAGSFEFYDSKGDAIDVDASLAKAYKIDVESSWSEFFLKSCSE